MSTAYLFIDRDGTLIEEPIENKQVDSLEKLIFEPNVITSLLALQKAGFTLVMVSNQDGLGTNSFPKVEFQVPHNKMMQLFNSENIYFENTLICPHTLKDNCSCRKPKLGLVQDYLIKGNIDTEKSYVIGDRNTDIELAQNMGITGIKYDRDQNNWQTISNLIINQPRTAIYSRQTKETKIKVFIDIDPIAEKIGHNNISTGIDFFDHMLDQIATHGNFFLNLKCSGDLSVDDHHTIEDCGIALGTTIKKALGKKQGIERFGFILPMDESEAHCSLDLSGRPHLKFDATFTREKIGNMATEMIPHFFQSLSYALDCTLHLKAKGVNNHHIIESLFKSLGRCLKQAIKISGSQLPSTKGLL